MATFKEANQVRLSLKMKLSHYAWYHNTEVFPAKDGYLVIVNVKLLNNNIKKIIPQFLDNVAIKAELV